MFDVDVRDCLVVKGRNNEDVQKEKYWSKVDEEHKIWKVPIDGDTYTGEGKSPNKRDTRPKLEGSSNSSKVRMAFHA